MMTELFQQALHINAPWLIKKVDFHADKKRLDIYIDFKKGSTFVDPDSTSDPAKMYKAYDTVQKIWQHLNFFGYECHLHARVPRIKRDDGKVRLVPTPWEGKVLGFTLLFEALLMQLCKAMPVHNVSQLTGVSDHKVWRVLDAYIVPDRNSITSDNPKQQQHVIGVSPLKILHFLIRNPIAQPAE
jgi:transposase